MGEKYSSSRSDVTIDSIVPQADGTIRAVATETTFLTTEGSGIEIVSRETIGCNGSYVWV